MTAQLRTTHARRMLLLALVAVSFAGCGECYSDCFPTDNAPTTIAGNWVGRASVGNAFLSVFAFPDGRVVAYVVDGQQTAEWFLRQPYPGNKMTLTSRFGSRLEFTIANAEFSATFVSVRSPTVLQFQVVAVTVPSGLWFGRQTLSDGVEYRGGWIVLPSGEQRGAVVLQASRELVATPTLTTSSPSGSVMLAGKGTLAVQYVTAAFADPTRF